MRRLEHTITAMRHAQPQPDADLAMARWKGALQECDAKLRQYRAALDAGVDPTVVTGWITHTQAERDESSNSYRKPYQAVGRRRRSHVLPGSQ